MSLHLEGGGMRVMVKVRLHTLSRHTTNIGGGGFTIPVTRPLRACTMLYHGNSVAILGTMVNVGRALVELCYYPAKSNEGWYKLGKTVVCGATIVWA